VLGHERREDRTARTKVTGTAHHRATSASGTRMFSTNGDLICDRCFNAEQIHQVNASAAAFTN
jgi:hypothetical protein